MLKKNLLSSNLFIKIAIACIALIVVIAILLTSNWGAFSGKSYKFSHYDKYVKLADYKKMKYQTNNKIDKNLRRQSVINQVVETSEMKKYPTKQVKAEESRSKQHYKNLAKRYKKSYDEVIAMTGVSKKQFNQVTHQYAKSTVKEKLVVNAIAKDEGIKLSRSEYNEYKDKNFKTFKMSEKQFKKTYGKSYKDYAEDNDFKSYALEQKVADRLLDISAKNVAKANKTTKK